MFTILKQKFVNWLLKDVHIQEAMFGNNSVKLTDLIKFTATASPTTAGELGMDTGTGRPQAFIGGLLKNLAHTDETGTPAADSVSFDLIKKTLIYDASHTVDSTDEIYVSVVTGQTGTGIIEPHLIVLRPNDDGGGSVVISIRLAADPNNGGRGFILQGQGGVGPQRVQVKVYRWELT